MVSPLSFAIKLLKEKKNDRVGKYGGGDLRVRYVK